jgi:CheY-like chemotaxis protein
MVGEDVELTVMLDPDLPPVLVDRAQIRQVMLNLIANSREAMPNGGTIKVITSLVTLDDRYAVNHEGVTPGPHVVLQIVDTGTGMDRRTRERIFDPYFTTKAHGTGLGLATVYGIIKQSGGHIWVYSEPGMGTTFKCHFPVAEGASPAVVEASPEPLAFDGTETILLVEDDPAVRPLIARIISSFGYTVIEAENGVEALEIVDRYDGPIDLVFTDVVMPTMNGRELSEQLAAKKPGIKVLFTSGYPADEVIRRGIADASSLFIEKPYVPDDLARKLREIFTGGVAPSE